MTPKKIPMRKCLGCGEMLPQKELIRVVKTKIRDEKGEEISYKVSIDPVGKMSGRGAYICKKKTCFDMTVKKKRLSRALGCEIPEEITDKIRQELTADE